MIKLRKSDAVLVLRGEDRGKTGKILKVFPKQQRVIVEGVSFIKRHMRPTQRNPKGGIVEKEAPIHVSKLMFQCPKCRASTKVGQRLIKAEGSNEFNKVRICKKCGEIV